MSFTAADELVIRHALADSLTAAGITYAMPSPIQFVDKADFWATVESPNDTRREIETELVSLCAITLRKFENVVEEGCEDEPLLKLTYNLYIFQEAGPDRVDETGTPDAFNKLLLESERAFVAAMLNVRAQFTGIRPLTGLPTGYAADTNDIAMDEFTRENDRCRYVPDATGFSVDMQTAVEVLISE